MTTPEAGRTRVVVTPGEPAGIGPDLVLALAQDPQLAATMLVAADPEALSARADRLGLPARLQVCDPQQSPEPAEDGALRVWSVPLPHAVRPGTPDARNAEHVLAALDLAVAACAEGRADALVTGPLQKSVINEAGHAFSGHTEYLAAATGAALPVMMLVAPDARSAPLRVALATTHLPLRDVADAITVDGLCRTLRVLDAGLRRDFGIAAPCIRVCGLNPHAGESGHLGHEDAAIITPAIAQARAEGIDASGPFPADTLFTPRHLEGCHAVLAMFHDQGLPVLKYAGFGHAVNVTLGLPIVRVSVDHGTALDLAGTGCADSGSLRAALRVADEIATARRA